MRLFKKREKRQAQAEVDFLVQYKGKVKGIDPRVLYREKRKDFQITQASRLRYRTRYFTDSGIVGSKEFVSANYQRFKHLFESKHEKKPKPIQGLSGIYSLKWLSETI